MKLILIVVFISWLTACGTNREIAPIDSKTGMLQSSGTIADARVLISKKIPLAKFKGMIVVASADLDSDEINKVDEVKQVKAINYFDDVYSVADLQKLVIANNLQDKVMTLSTMEGLRDLYRSYRPFLFLHFKCIKSEEKYYRLIATNPDTMEDVFVSEVKIKNYSKTAYNLAAFLTLGAGMHDYDYYNNCDVSDPEVRFSIFNSLIVWINHNK